MASLAAEGYSNREIAQALVVTVKTVEWHLGHAYAKLGVKFKEAVGRQLPSNIEPWTTIRQLVTVVAETHIPAFGMAKDAPNDQSW